LTGVIFRGAFVANFSWRKLHSSSVRLEGILCMCAE
jgi:hypothetical protein